MPDKAIQTKRYVVTYTFPPSSKRYTMTIAATTPQAAKNSVEAIHEGSKAFKAVVKKEE